MANNTLFGLPFDAAKAAVLSNMADQNGNPMATAIMEQIARAATTGNDGETPGNAPQAPGAQANAQAPNPALTTVQNPSSHSRLQRGAYRSRRPVVSRRTRQQQTRSVDVGDAYSPTNPTSTICSSAWVQLASMPAQKVAFKH